jgi:hypothetical protein
MLSHPIPLVDIYIWMDDRSRWRDVQRSPAFARSAHFDLRFLIHDLYFLIQKYGVIWTIQRERRDFNIKTLSVLSLHLISPAHHPRRRVQRRATRIFKALSRFEDRLLPHNTGSFDLRQFSSCICDHPVPAQQVHRFRSLILDDHSICPKILRVVWRRPRLKVSGLNAHRYSSSVCHIRCPTCH